MRKILRTLKKSFLRDNREINPEDIFLDSTNLPNLNQDRLEGMIERPIGEKTFLFVRVVLSLVLIFLGAELWILQVSKGEVYREISEENRLGRTAIFADRGIIFDRNGLPLVVNEIKPDESDFAARKYPNIEGLGAVVGYVKYPSMDSAKRYYDELFHGQSGVEKTYDSLLSGSNGSKLTETNALGEKTSESIVDSPQDGKDIHLSIDAKLTEKLFQSIRATSKEKGFTGGAGVIMDVETGEVLALTSYPSYDQNIVTEGKDSAEISKLLNDKSTPFLNRAVSGLYTPGSIVKPIVALGALNEGVITSTKQILSTGQISLPNPYDPKNPSIFRDWRAHGWVDMIDALAVSSDVYFYEVGGGFGNQKGLGISNLDKYFSLFGMNEKTNIDLPGEEEGYIATPSWKEKNFPDDPIWRVGNTYHTSIGQYGTQVTPIEVVRWVAAIANGGKLITPRVLFGINGDKPRVDRRVDLAEDFFVIVRKGMREGVTRGVATGLSIPEVKVAAKTGTAELGARKEFVNSWITGFFPYDTPKYAFAIIMERGPVTNTVGGVFVMRQVLDWMTVNTPEYLK